MSIAAFIGSLRRVEAVRCPVKCEYHFLKPVHPCPVPKHAIWILSVIEEAQHALRDGGPLITFRNREILINMSHRGHLSVFWKIHNGFRPARVSFIFTFLGEVLLGHLGFSSFYYLSNNCLFLLEFRTFHIQVARVFTDHCLKYFIVIW